MSICGICGGKINDGKPFDEEHKGYDGCEEDTTQEYENFRFDEVLKNDRRIS